jgi:glycosyltransferase involved in cell wall biosynthesis
MDWPIVLLAVVLACVWPALAILVILCSRQIPLLREVLGPIAPALPSLSVVVTARDEAARIEDTVRRLLAQEYPRLEILVVDDRSTDGTAEILDRLAAGAADRISSPAAPPRLAIEHVRDLPAGWLGKCHACRRGADRARGEFLLFLDGDVALADQHLLARVMTWVEARRIDHLAVLPDLRPTTRLQAGLLSVFDQMLLLFVRAWEIDRDRPRGGGGVGAFNLVRRSSYDRIGGHELLRMEVVDDYKLGVLLKESGARQRMASGLDLVHCPWHRGAWGVVRGLEKNVFAGIGYSVPRLVLFTLAALGLVYGPAALALHGPAPWAAAPLGAQAAALLAAFTAERRRLATPPILLWVLYPLAAGLMILAAWNSALTTLAQGGIRWRGTFYPLEALRRGSVPVGAGRRFLIS